MTAGPDTIQLVFCPLHWCYFFNYERFEHDVRVVVFRMVASGISMLFIGPKVRFHTAASTPLCCQLQRSIRVRNFDVVPAGEC